MQALGIFGLNKFKRKKLKHFASAQASSGCQMLTSTENEIEFN